MCGRVRRAGAVGSPVAAVARGKDRHPGPEPPLRACLRCRRPAQWKPVPEYGEEPYEDEGVVPADGLDPVTFCEEWAPEDGGFIPPPNSPREGVNCRELLR